MKHLVSIVLLLSFLNNSLVFADGQIVEIKKDEKASFDGFLIDQKKAKSIDNLRLDFEFSQKNITVLQDQNKLYSDQLTKSNELISNLNKQALEQKSDSMWKSIGFFVLGSVITGAIAYGTTRVILK